jgi:broad specificity phosphatase PhoE
LSPTSRIIDSVARVLFLARHGETAWNLEQRWQGQTDVDLNDSGRAQATALAARLAAHRIARIVTSDLSRARETAEIIGRRLGIDGVLLDAGLRERGYGIFEGLTRAECEAQHPEEWARYVADHRHTPARAELDAVVAARMQAAVARAGALANGDGGAVLVISHGGSIRALIAAATGWRPPPMGNGDTYRVTLGSDDLVREPALLP